MQPLTWKYAAPAILVPLVITVLAIANWETSLGSILLVVAMWCGYPMVLLGFYMWFHGCGSRWINIGIDWKKVPDGEDKRYASYYGRYLMVGSVVMTLSLAMMSWNLIAGFVVLILSMLFFILPVLKMKPGKMGSYAMPSYGTGKKAMMIVATSIVVIAGCVGLTMMEDQGNSVNAILGEESLHVTAPMFDHTFGYDEIDELEYIDDFSKGSRMMGYADGHISSGKFKNDLFGKYELASYSKVKPVIALSMNGHMYAFNLGSAEDTHAFYEQLSAKIPVKNAE